MAKKYDRTLPSRWADLARVFTALGEQYRQRILLMFERGEELTIKDVADACPLSRTAISHHIRVLREAGILRAEKRGKEVFLSIDTGRVLDSLDAVRDYVREKL
ncbi:MAG TPA: metalloregulator ArsR/SmtB family transcription factor [Burkholderiales bacterium]|nr:metalloregulator ArsR/SmtB family transcription factor [Burkholderiales bacterium]